MSQPLTPQEAQRRAKEIADELDAWADRFPTGVGFPTAGTRDLLYRAAAALREAVEAEREQCCKDVCHWCQIERATETRHGACYHLAASDGTYTIECRADAIRRRAEKGGGM